MFFQMKPSKLANRDHSNERIIRNRRETCTPWNVHKEKGAKNRERERKKERRNVFREIGIYREKKEEEEEEEGKKDGTHLWLCWGGLVPSPRRRKRPPGPRSSSCWSQVLTAALVPVYLKRYIPQLFIKSLNLTSIYSSRAKRFRFVIKKIVQFFR